MPKRQSSSKASTIAGRVQAAMRQDARRRKELGMTHVEPPVQRFINAAELKTLAASVLAQDETRGQRLGSINRELERTGTLRGRGLRLRAR